MSDDEMPLNPFVNADFVPLAKGAYEIYQTLKSAGFNDMQAMQLTVAIVTTMMTGIPAK
jgi:hypothetical protein